MAALPQLNLWSAHRAMLRIRRVEEALAEKYAEQQMRCPMHLCIGQEAISVGVCATLTNQDVVFSNHRAHGHYLAKGGDLKRMIAELYGRSTGCCGGRGGSMHLVDLDVNFLGSTPIVGGTVPLAVGAAWAARLKGDDRLSVAFFGDGGVEEGVVHESMNFAALHRLPVLFVCENNNFSVYTPLKERQPNQPIYKMAEAHGLTSWHGDGNDVETVFNIARQATQAIHNQQGPQFIELSTYRWREHCGPNFDNELNYRTAEEITTGMAACPLAKSRKNILAAGTQSMDQLQQLENEIDREIAAAFEFALSSPIPTYTDAVGKVYAQ
ncbi:MAG: thiamine pyrophosphate-dependent dehydrogenase E1 component subunit alpha [Gammaproteobacteria bacterium]|nr:thiamine pyrophosphate-dependent dehydrogenase E1 component subunit alpha [Gammaproteobacteria bacterium]